MGLAGDDRLGAIVHELGNVIGAVLNWGALASRRDLPDDAAADLDQLRSAAERAAGLVRELAQCAPLNAATRTHPVDGAADG
jgi:hypothetical protein